MKISLWVYMSVFVHVRVCACLLGAVQFDNYERGEVTVTINMKLESSS